MVSGGVCFGEKGRLHFIPDTAKVNAKLYVETLLPELFQDCRFVLPSGFIFQQDGAPAHTAKLTGLLPTAVNSLVKMNGLRTRLTSDLWTTTSGQLYLSATSHSNPSRRTSMSSRKFCSWYGTSCHGTRSTKRRHIELPGKTSGLCESWWWTLRTYAKMNCWVGAVV